MSAPVTTTPIEVGVRAHLLADVALAALIGTRAYMLVLPQQPTLPAVRLQLISENDTETLSGETTNFFRARVQIDAYARAASGVDPYASARQVGRAITRALRPASDMGFTVGTDLYVSSVQVLDRATEYDADELNLVRVRQDFGVCYRELA